MATTRRSLTAAVRRRLGDLQAAIWSDAEVILHLQTGYRHLAAQTRVFWDQAWPENLPAGFSCTQAWETADETFSYGVAQMTYEDERREAAWDEMTGPANHTCPSEIAFLSALGASIDSAATVDLSTSVLEIDRGVWDECTLEATTPQRAARFDPRYQITAGEVYAFTFRQDGPQTIRKIRVPNALADVYTVSGSWGLLRDATDIIGTTTVTGTWGIARRLPLTFPMGWDSPWGAARRVYRPGKNVRFDHWREGRPLLEADDVCELPDHYAHYLLDYALARCLGRRGPGQDPRLAAYYEQRWARGLARIQRRVTRTAHAHVGVLGANQTRRESMPPRPKLPWQYGQRTRP